MLRKIIKIDEERCNGCGLCANACHEGAIDIVDGKAKLMREHFCDGLGDCLPACPMNAISFEMREAPGYDEQAVLAALSPDWGEDILRVTLRGEWETKPGMESLAEVLEDRCWSLDLRDETRLTRDIWKMADEDTLRGSFLRILRKQYETAGEEEKQERITRAARFGLAAMEYREDM